MDSEAIKLSQLQLNVLIKTRLKVGQHGGNLKTTRGSEGQFPALSLSCKVNGCRTSCRRYVNLKILVQIGQVQSLKVNPALE